jgi:hypothetical protein
MINLGSTSFVISPKAAKAFPIPVVKRPKLLKSEHVSGNSLKTENLFTVPLRLSFGKYRSYDKHAHAFKVIKTSQSYDALIPAWYLEHHKVRGTTTSHWHFPYCPAECYIHGKIHLEYSITYPKRKVLKDKVIHIGAIVMSNPPIA